MVRQTAQPKPLLCSRFCLYLLLFLLEMFPLREKNSAKYGLLSGLSGRLCGPCHVHTAGSQSVGNGTMYTWVCSGWDGRPFIPTEAPVCGKTLWGGGWKEVRRKPQKSNPACLLLSRTACLLKTVQSLPSKVGKTEEKIWSLKEVIVSSVPFSVFVELVWWWVSWAD